MEMPSYNNFSCCFLLFFALICLLQPVMADNGTITIAYRGSGGGYVGETVVFDGRNTYSNSTLIRITGPGLPSDGVPANNLNGPSGTGTPVEVDQYGAWKFVWYASIIPGVEKLKTGRYTFIATDFANPEKKATSSFMLKKPEYSVTASPDPVNPGKYIEIVGTAEQGISTAKIEIKDTAGTVLHSFTSPVSSSGYFSYGFHEDMGPGTYTVKVSNPALKTPFGTTFSVVPEEGTLPVTMVMTSPVPSPVESQPVSAAMTVDMTSPATQVPVSATTPAQSPVAPVTNLMALAVGIIALASIRR